MTTHAPLSRFSPPLHGARNPGREPTATTPGSFALAPDVGGPLMFASPDTPGMPAPSDKTAWDFLPEGWKVSRCQGAKVSSKSTASSSLDTSTPRHLDTFSFETARGERITVTPTPGFTPIT